MKSLIYPLKSARKSPLKSICIWSPELPLLPAIFGKRLAASQMCISPHSAGFKRTLQLAGDFLSMYVNYIFLNEMFSEVSFLILMLILSL